MGEIINLNQYRKALRRLQKAPKSAENRVKFGRLKSEREADNREIARKAHLMDLAKIESVPVTLPKNKTSGAAPKPPRHPESPGKRT